MRREKCGKWDWHPENWCFVKEKCKKSKKSESLDGHWWYEGCTIQIQQIPIYQIVNVIQVMKVKIGIMMVIRWKNTCGNWDAYGKNWCYVKENVKTLNHLMIMESLVC